MSVRNFSPMTGLVLSIAVVGILWTLLTGEIVQWIPIGAAILIAAALANKR
jgi:hypothetical protein